MKSIKYLVVLACMTLGMVNVAKAQVINDEVMFFQKTTESGGIRIIRFLDGKLATGAFDYSQSKVKNDLGSSLNYYDAYPKGFGSYSYYCYDETLSTSSRIVYVKNDYGIRHCYAISTDMTSLIKFSINRDGEVSERYNEYYVRVSKEDLLPKSVNSNDLEFLNE